MDGEVFIYYSLKKNIYYLKTKSIIKFVEFINHKLNFSEIMKKKLKI